jgi:SagB-type dehydrogenase family enzyme
LSLEELTYLLWNTQGVDLKGNKLLRTVPSAGGRHPFETFLVINNVADLKPGLYRYLAMDHKLALLLESEDLSKKLVDISYGQKFLEKNAVTFIWLADTYRMNWRYGSRGYRYLFIEAGHVAQNLLLSAESIECGACVIGKYSDDAINKLLGVDGQEHFVIYMASVGKI